MTTSGALTRAKFPFNRVGANSPWAQCQFPLQKGTNKFASQKGMTGFGTNRRETTKMLDTAHPEYSHESSIDQTSIPYQMGSNRYASQKGMTGFGQPRWEVLDPSISYQNRKSQGKNIS
jgi:hypothetical protein